MNKINNLFCSLAILSAPVMADGYIIQQGIDGIGDSRTPVAEVNPKDGIYESCVDLKAKYPAADTGVYNITINNQVFKGYCNQTFKGGGWQLVQIRGPVISDFLENNNIGDSYKSTAIGNISPTLSDTVWQSLKTKSSTILYYVNSNQYAYLSIAKASNASCTKLNGTLKQMVLMHDELDSCNAGNYDYSFFGTDSQGIADWAYNDNNYFDAFVGGNREAHINSGDYSKIIDPVGNVFVYVK
jgi:hypothetical protein